MNGLMSMMVNNIDREYHFDKVYTYHNQVQLMTKNDHLMMENLIEFLID
jgi:ABC-type sugar transport system ATPase subunit